MKSLIALITLLIFEIGISIFLSRKNIPVKWAWPIQIIYTKVGPILKLLTFYAALVYFPALTLEAVVWVILWSLFIKISSLIYQDPYESISKPLVGGNFLRKLPDVIFLVLALVTEIYFQRYWVLLPVSAALFIAGFFLLIRMHRATERNGLAAGLWIIIPKFVNKGDIFECHQYSKIGRISWYAKPPTWQNTTHYLHYRLKQDPPCWYLIDHAKYDEAGGILYNSNLQSFETKDSKSVILVISNVDKDKYLNRSRSKQIQ